jgi:Bacterial Ig domain
MNKKGLGSFLQCLVAGSLLFAFQAQAQPQFPPEIDVTADGGDFYPDPVNIVTGEVVYWSGSDYMIGGYPDNWQLLLPGGLIFYGAGSYTYLDEYGNVGTVNVTANIPPTVTITSPTNQMTFTSPATIDFSADGEDTDADGLYSVQLWLGSKMLTEVLTAPFITTLTNLAPGSYVLTAIAYDNVDAAATNQIKITVISGGGSNPLPITVAVPRLAAGNFQFDVSGLTVGKTNMVETIADPSLGNWAAVVTNVATTATMTFATPTTNSTAFFRVVQLP